MKRILLILAAIITGSRLMAMSNREICADYLQQYYNMSLGAYLITDARITDGPKFFEMYYDQERYIPVYLRGGKKYLFVVAGDDRVRDLDLFVYDPGGKLAKSNRTFDTDAGFWYIAERTGRYMLKVRMADCERGTGNMVGYIKAEFSKFYEKRWWSSFPP